MLIRRQNLSVIIVSFNSDHVIHRCISSIDKEIEIIVIDNSNNTKFKNNIEEQYKNVKCILSTANIGMGAGNNLGIKNTDKDFALILNPDVILNKNTIEELIKASSEVDSFGLIAPISDKSEYPNYKFDKNENQKFNQFNPFKVKSVDGYSMLLNLKKLRKSNFNFFDENIFLYLENDDLCKRLIDLNENIYIIPKAKINHLGASATSKKYSYQIEMSRNWHWMWSKFYFKRKHQGYLFALISGFPKFLSSILKFLFYILIKKQNKKQIYLHRASGYLNALLGRKSFYRPKLD